MIDWESLKVNEKALPDDKILSDLYALSRKIKRTEVDTTKSQVISSSGEEKNIYSNQFFMNAFAQLSFITPGCKIGQCCFCTYGAGKVQLTPKIVAREMDKFKESILDRIHSGENIYAILLDSVGSILDYNEFSPECLEVVFEKLDELLDEVKSIESVGFETHYQTLGSYDEKGEYVCSDAIARLIDFKKKHADKNTFVVELGFETANSELRDTLLFKHIDNETYKRAVELLRKNGIEVEVNVMATLPFLTQREQIENSTQSIIQALKPQEDGGFGVNSVTLFPLNVRKHTFCNYVFDVQEKFNSDNQTESPDWLRRNFPIWSMVATLNELIMSGHEDMLENVSVAWFGGRQLSNDGSEVYPEGWEQTYDDFVEYRKNRKGRAEIVKRLAQKPEFIEFMKRVEAEKSKQQSFMDRAKYIHELISQSSLPYLPESCCSQEKS